ncbi:bifunctional acetate--CoA ligase family protein/GNAT family N-acetyltransferase [Ideonella sp. DXS29W]|uniref:Bifunctional acetate--CoA ligase family protein/GNAT family N-acetyltransferase n=1 Tax=Ideonella lacteola TaxID=2984193 RepID=A0ABU9BJA5_9BURK
MSVIHLSSLLSPASVVVLGASDRDGSVGATVWRNLRSRFRGPTFAVNPRLSTLDGEPVHARVADLPQVPELALLCTPPATVPGLIAELARAGTRAAIVMTAGLDAAQKQAALHAARPHRMRLLGPNCIGLLSPKIGLNASFAHTDAQPGPLALVSQSGALLTAVLDWARARQIGFSHLVSLGERMDVDAGDLLDHLASDASTRAILLYLESVEAARKFMSAARAAARNKPVIVVKAGRAGQGMKAAASHTGALAGSDVVIEAAIRRAGMLRVDTLQDLFLAAETLARFAPRGEGRLALMTNGGGAGVLAADAAARVGLELATLSDATLAELDAALPGTWSHGNPVDIIGDAPVARYHTALRTLLAAPEVDAVLFMHAPTAIVRSDEIARACAPLVRSAEGRVMACWLGDPAVAEARRIFEQAGAADYPTPEEAVRAFAMLASYRRNQAQLMEVPSASEYGPPDVAAARRLIGQALADGRELLNETEAKQVLRAYGIPTVPTEATRPSADAAAEAARRLGYPVALKILSPDISHKSDVGGVALGLADEAALCSAVARMLERVGAARPDARLTGFSVQPMAQRPHAQELIVGASIDAGFGPVVMVGRGGTAVEVEADRVIGLPPLNRVLAREMISRTAVARLLAGYRDHPPAQLDAIADVLMAVAQMQADLPELAELDINPLWADEHGVLALDARIRVAASAPAGPAHFAIQPYPADWARRVDWQGTPLCIRPIRPEDEPQHRAFIDHVSADDLRLRFFSVRRELPRREFARLTQIDYGREMAFIAVREGTTPETLGVARAITDPDGIEAEFAVVVRTDLHRQGLGRLLMQQLADYLAARGVQRMVGNVLRENDAMRAMARRMGFDTDPTSSDREMIRVVRLLQAPREASAS